METKKCECGCGIDVVSKYRNGPLKGQFRRFVFKHQSRGRANEWSRRPESQNTRTGRWRARLSKEINQCEIECIGGCKGRIEVHHKDKNPLNNVPSNLMSVCKAHHGLLDGGKIDWRNPVMPSFYVDGSGKRRYAKSNSRNDRLSGDS